MLDHFVKLLKSGEIVAFPTETVYGLGADAWNPDAVQKVFELKGRPSDNPLIVHIADRRMVDDFALVIPPQASKLMDHFWPGPLTLIFKKKPEVLDLVTGGLNTVALRWPSHPFSQELISRVGPLVAPSANTSGRPSPTRPEHVKEDFGDHFPVLEAGETQIGLESTVLDISEQPYRIYRPGFIGKQALEDVLETEIIIFKQDDADSSRSPGTRYSHYAPTAEVQWLKSDEDPTSDEAMYLLHRNKPGMGADTVHFYDGDYSRMARELYDRFREADHKNLQKVVIEPLPETLQEKEPVARALANRISKAIGSR